MIRSTVNGTIKTVTSETRSETKEICEGSLDGLLDSALHEMNEVEWLANKAINANTTITIVPSDSHNV